MNDFFQFIIAMILIVLFFRAIAIYNRKFNGTTLVAHSYQRKEAENIHKGEKSRLDRLKEEDPKNVHLAIELCQKKGYALTSDNILVEYEKVLNGDTLTFFEKAGKASAKVVSNTKKNIQEISIDKSSLTAKIKELEKLKNSNIITEEEFERKKQELIDKF